MSGIVLYCIVGKNYDQLFFDKLHFFYSLKVTRFSNNQLFYIARYDGIGAVLGKKTAQHTAAEVCLRTLGDLPDVPRDQYTIQPYRGGKTRDNGLEKPPPQPMFSLLCHCLSDRHHPSPIVTYKEESSVFHVAIQIGSQLFRSSSLGM